MRLIRLLIVLLGIGCLTGRLVDADLLDYIFKPLLMPALVLLVARGAQDAGHKDLRWFYATLFFCWLGDIFLMLQKQMPSIFVVGLGSFLIAHLIYIRLFLSQASRYPTKSLLERQPFWVIPILLIGGGFYWGLSDKLGDLMVPVLVYALVLMSMAIAALHRVGRSPVLSGRWVMLGATLFLISDLLIGINKFGQPLPFAGFWIMLSYISGQWLIAEGVLYPLRKEEEGSANN